MLTESLSRAVKFSTVKMYHQWVLTPRIGDKVDSRAGMEKKRPRPKSNSCHSARRVSTVTEISDLSYIDVMDVNI